MRDLLRALAVVAEGDAGAGRVAEALTLGGPIDPAAHVELFDFELYPYASVYLGAEGMLGGEAGDRVAGFWRALQLQPPAEPDHLASLLGLLAALLDRAATEGDPARRALLDQAARALLWEHLLSWLPLWCERALERTVGSLRRWAELLSETMTALATSVGPPGALPAALLAAAPAIDRGVDRPEVMASALLTPVRTGAIVLRHDLRRLADELGVGLRAGERRFALRALLEQDREATLSWMSHFIGRQAARTAAWPAAWEPVMGFWSTRATASAAALATSATIAGAPSGA